MRHLFLGSCLLVVMGSAGITHAASPFLPSASLPKNMEAPVPPPQQIVEETNLRDKVARGELRYIGSVNNQGIYFDLVLKTYTYHDELPSESTKEAK